MAFKISPDLATAQQLERVMDRLLGLPAPGVRIGPIGIPVPQPVAWDGTGPTPPGWTSYRNSSREHPTNKGTFATPIDDGAAGALAVDTKLTAPEKTTMSTAIAAAVTLPADWNPNPVQVQAIPDTP